MAQFVSHGGQIEYTVLAHGRFGTSAGASGTTPVHTARINNVIYLLSGRGSRADEKHPLVFPFVVLFLIFWMEVAPTSDVCATFSGCRSWASVGAAGLARDSANCGLILR